MYYQNSWATLILSPIVVVNGTSRISFVTDVLFLHHLFWGNCGSGGTTAINLGGGSPAVAVNQSVLEQDANPPIGEVDEQVEVRRGVVEWSSFTGQS